MSERYFSTEPITGELVRLDGPESHHLLHVMRAAVGDSVTLFDGGGAEFAAVVESLSRSEVRFRILERREVDRELPFALALAVALPKGDRQKWLVEKLTELGATSLVPLVTERSVAQPTASALERLRRTVIEAAKQCGRNRLMTIHDPVSWSDWLAAPDSSQASNRQPAGMQRLLAHPSGTLLREIDIGPQLSIQLAIGPEGGFGDAEVTAAIDAGWKAVRLGSRILRVETAAVALAAALALHR